MLEGETREMCFLLLSVLHECGCGAPPFCKLLTLCLARASLKTA